MSRMVDFCLDSLATGALNEGVQTGSPDLLLPMRMGEAGVEGGDQHLMIEQEEDVEDC